MSSQDEGPDIWLTWCVALVSTAIAGAIFGLIEAGIVGLIAGMFIAAISGVPIVITIGILTWATGLWRLSRVMAGLAGAATGITCTAMLWEPAFLTGFVASIVFAGFIGGIMPPLLLTYVFYVEDRPPDASKTESFSWQFSLRDLFLRFTVLAALIAAWTFGIAKFIEVRHTPPKSSASQSR